MSLEALLSFRWFHRAMHESDWVLRLFTMPFPGRVIITDWPHVAVGVHP